MPMPQINITFRQAGIEAVQRSQKGVVAMVLIDTHAAVKGEYQITSITDLSGDNLKNLSAANKAQVTFALMGYVNPPRLVLLYVVDGTENTLEHALKHFATQAFDYLVIAPELDESAVRQTAMWVKSERQNDHLVKAVLPNIAADSEAIVNFATDEIITGTQTLAAEDYCSRIAGLIAGTPMTISATYAPLPEVTDCTRLTKAERDAAVDAGEFIIWHDGKSVLTGRAVNSLTTTTQEKGDKFQKIKIVETMDMIANDIRSTARQSYIGKYANSYDNKCLLIVAIQAYMEELETGGLLERGSSVVEMDLARQEAYLKQQSEDTAAMTEQQIKEANTGSNVFLHISAKGILDAIEDIEINVTV